MAKICLLISQVDRKRSKQKRGKEGAPEERREKMTPFGQPKPITTLNSQETAATPECCAGSFHEKKGWGRGTGPVSCQDSHGAAETSQNTLTPDSTRNALSQASDVGEEGALTLQDGALLGQASTWAESCRLSPGDQKWQVDIEFEVSEILRGS